MPLERAREHSKHSAVVIPNRAQSAHSLWQGRHSSVPTERRERRGRREREGRGGEGGE